VKREYDAERSVKEFVHIFKQGVISDFDNPVYYNTSPDLS
jgi:hypothetical protein